MEPAVFERFRDIIYKKSGIALKPDKMSLLSSRIQKRIRERGLSDEAQYLEIIELDVNGDELVHLIDAISTNTTYFWREAEHFTMFGDLLETSHEEGKKKLRIWCAAASTGQEPYTLAMIAHQRLPLAQCDVRLLATDVSTKALNVATQGTYASKEISKLPPHMQSTYFSRAQANSDAWSVIAPIRQMILYKRLNLIAFPYPLRGPLDFIFCRNVMIYFDLETRQKIIDQFYRLLSPGGVLFLSLSESLLGIEHRLVKVSTSVYQKQG